MGRFPRAVIAKTLAQGDTANTTERQGAALESAVTKCFCAVRGVGFLKRDTTNNAGSAEIDILLYNQAHPLGFPFLPPYLMFECKNWNSPVNCASVEHFISKVRASHLKFGVIVAANGITGDFANRRAAVDAIIHAFDSDQIVILVITREEIEGFYRSEDVVRLLKDKFGSAILRLAAV